MINHDLDTISGWTDRFGLIVNPTKSQTIILGSQRITRRPDPDILQSILYILMDQLYF